MQSLLSTSDGTKVLWTALPSCGLYFLEEVQVRFGGARILVLAGDFVVLVHKVTELLQDRQDLGNSVDVMTRRTILRGEYVDSFTQV